MTKVGGFEGPDTFRFDQAEHRYFLNGQRVASITQMLEAFGYITDEWYTEEGSERGTVVHKLTADYDLGAIDNPRAVESVYKGYLLAHVAAMASMGRPRWDEIEVARCHPKLKFGGRPDRVGLVWDARTVLDIKTGAAAEWHSIQTALQAILVAPSYRLLPEAVIRYGLYLRESGKYALIEHKDRRDFAKALEVIRECAAVAA